MIIDELISTRIPAISPQQTGAEVLDLMDDIQRTQLPVVDGETYLGLLRENDLLDWTNPQLAIQESGLLNFKPAVPTQSHPLQAWRVAMQHELQTLPVVSEADQYLGAVDRADLTDFVAGTTGYEQPGGIIVLQMKRSQYTLSGLAQIAESEDISIMGVGMTEPDENGEVSVTLKTNSTDLAALIASLDRHDYQVTAIIGAEAGQADLMNRYQLLMNYINM